MNLHSGLEEYSKPLRIRNENLWPNQLLLLEVLSVERLEINELLKDKLSMNLSSLLRLTASHDIRWVHPESDGEMFCGL